MVMGFLVRESDRIGGRSSGHCEPAFIDPFSVSEPEIFSQQGPVHHRNLRIYTLLLMLYEPCSPSSRGINVRVMLPECRPDRRNSSALEPYHVIMTGIKRIRPFQGSRERILVEAILAGEKPLIMGKGFAQILGNRVTKSHHRTVCITLRGTNVP